MIIGIIFDNSFSSLIVNYRFSIFTSFMHFISFLGSALFVAVISTLLFAYDKEGRKYIPALWLTLGLALLLIVILKYITARPRPNIAPLELETNYSFPSAHATAVFAPLILVDKLFPKIKWLWFGVALLVLFSRLYLGVHYISDVIAGALIGYIIGIIVLRVIKINF